MNTTIFTGIVNDTDAVITPIRLSLSAVNVLYL